MKLKPSAFERKMATKRSRQPSSAAALVMMLDAQRERGVEKRRVFFENLVRVLELHEWMYKDGNLVFCATCGTEHRDNSKNRRHKSHCEYVGVLAIAREAVKDPELFSGEK